MDRPTLGRLSTGRLGVSPRFVHVLEFSYVVDLEVVVPVLFHTGTTSDIEDRDGIFGTASFESRMTYREPER